MVDLARLLALAIATWRCLRERGPLPRAAALVLLVALYIFALEVTAGITVREAGPMSPAGAMILLFVGPSGMPRGALPAWLPLGQLYLHHPFAPELLVLALLWSLARRFERRAVDLPISRQSEALSLDRVHLSLVLYVVICAIEMSTSLVPHLLGADLGSGREDSTQ